MSKPPEALWPVKFWDYQHYRERRPPWIKLYRSILDDRDLSKLSEGARFVTVGLLLLCCEESLGVLSYDCPYIARRLSTTGQLVSRTVKSLNQAGFIALGASTALAERSQDARQALVLTRARTEKEIEIETPLPPYRKNGQSDHRCPECGVQQQGDMSLANHRYVVHDIPLPSEAE